MEKIVIIGSPGSGKSTFARKLRSILNIKVYHLDRFFWQRDWERKSKDTRIDILQNLIREKQWIIDGTYLTTSELHLEAADTIIFLDIDPLMCLQRIIKRHYEYYGRSRRDIPEGCKDKPNLIRILKVLAFPLKEGRELKENLRKIKFRKSKQIILLRSRKEVESFLTLLISHADEKRQFSKTPFVAGKRLLAMAKR
jgi:adenylate kinase family enzyme